MTDFNHLLFLPVDIPNPPNVSSIIKEKAVEEDFYTDHYRNCKHLYIYMNKERGEINGGKYTRIGKEMHELTHWMENVLFKIFDRGDVVIITTQPNDKNPSHIDCSPGKFNSTLQHKFRYVLQGNIDTLHFEHANGVVTPEHIDKPFIMSGKWPHHMTNTNNIKYTLALGAPWEASLKNDKYSSLLNSSFNKYKEYYLSSKGMELPDGWFNLFETNKGYENQLPALLESIKHSSDTQQS